MGKTAKRVSVVGMKLENAERICRGYTEIGPYLISLQKYVAKGDQLEIPDKHNISPTLYSRLLHHGRVVFGVAQKIVNTCKVAEENRLIRARQNPEYRSLVRLLKKEGRTPEGSAEREAAYERVAIALEGTFEDVRKQFVKDNGPEFEGFL